MKNREVKKFEHYLEKRNSVLELRLSAKDWHSANEKGKEKLLDKLKKFKASDIIKRIERQENISASKIEEHIKALETSQKKSFLDKILDLFL